MLRSKDENVILGVEILIPCPNKLLGEE